MKWTNLLGTITAILTVVSGVMVSVLGCAPGAADFAATCAVPWLPPEYAIIAGTIFGALTFVLKLMRPGGALRSLFGSTAVVVPATSPASGPGTATPEDVARP